MTAPSTTAPSMTAPIMTSPTTVTTAGEEDKFAAGPSFGAPVGTGARAVIPGSVSLVKATGTAVFGTVPGGSSLASYKEVAQAFSGFAPAGPKVEMIKGQTADGNTRLLYASIGDGKAKQSYWWYAPTDQPEGWFDDQGHRLGGTVLAEPKPRFGASPRRSAGVNSTAGSPAPPSTTASISRARSASRSSPPPTAS